MSEELSEAILCNPDNWLLDDVRKQPLYLPGLDSTLRHAYKNIPHELRMTEDEFMFDCNNLHHAIRTGLVTKEQVGTRYRALVDQAKYLPTQFEGRWDEADLERRAESNQIYVRTLILDAWGTWREPAACFDRSDTWSEYLSGIPCQSAKTSAVEITLDNALLMQAPDYENMPLHDPRIRKVPSPAALYGFEMALIFSTIGNYIIAQPRTPQECFATVLCGMTMGMLGAFMGDEFSKPFTYKIPGQEQDRDNAERSQARDQVKNTENKPDNGEETTACYFSPT
jgi:hypothetical protein